MISGGTPPERPTWGNGPPKPTLQLHREGTLLYNRGNRGPHGPKLDIPSPKPVQVSDLILRSNTQPGFTPSVGVSDSDSFAINPATLESGGFWEGHQSSFKTSDT
jgi:hypothetical protein